MTHTSPRVRAEIARRALRDVCAGDALWSGVESPLAVFDEGDIDELGQWLLVCVRHVAKAPVSTRSWALDECALSLAIRTELGDAARGLIDGERVLAVLVPYLVDADAVCWTTLEPRFGSSTVAVALLRALNP